MQITHVIWQFRRDNLEFRQNLGDAFKSIRLQKQLKQTELARRADESSTRVGVTQKDIQRLEQGKANKLSLNKARGLAQLVGLSIEELVELADRRSSTPVFQQREEPSHVTYLRQQREFLLNSTLLPWVQEAAVAFRFLWPELVIPSPVQLRKHPSSGTIEDVVPLLNSHRVLAVTGAPGSGKTTSLRFLWLTLCDGVLGQKHALFPLYFHIRDLVSERRRPLRNLVDRIRLPKGYETVLLADGLDEVAPDEREKALSLVVAAGAVKSRVVVACRSDIFAGLMTNEAVAGKIDEVTELQPWTLEEHSLPFSQAYCKKIGRPGDYGRLTSYIAKIPSVANFITNPFQLTLVLFLLQTEERLSRKFFENRYTLYRAFYTHWLRKERHRGTSTAHDKQVREFHRMIARMLFHSKPGGIPIASVIGAIPANVAEDSAARHLLDVYSDPSDGQTYIGAFRHQTLLEYILAEHVVEAMRMGGEALRTALEPEYNYEVNSFVRDALLLMDHADRAKICSTLEEQFRSLSLPVSKVTRLAKRYEKRASRPEHRHLKEQIIYYIGRLELPICPKVLLDAFKSERDPVIQRAAALGAALHGEESVERDYLRLISNDRAAALLNRSFQLVYFGDVKAGMYDYRDDGSAPWTNTRDAIFRRLEGTKPRDLRLRWWDILTLTSFYETRPSDQISNELLVLLDRSDRGATGSASRRAHIVAAKNRLLKLLRKRVSS